jgi:hypothetical protein
MLEIPGAGVFLACFIKLHVIHQIFANGFNNLYLAKKYLAEKN